MGKVLSIIGDATNGRLWGINSNNCNYLFDYICSLREQKIIDTEEQDCILYVFNKVSLPNLSKTQIDTAISKIKNEKSNFVFVKDCIRILGSDSMKRALEIFEEVKSEFGGREKAKQELFAVTALIFMAN